nr:hypothetical protein Iba_chr13aCG11950 [Ipomoea batatas]
MEKRVKKKIPSSMQWMSPGRGLHSKTEAGGRTEKEVVKPPLLPPQTTVAGEAAEAQLDLLPPERKQNRGATGSYCRRKENRRKKRHRPLQPEVVAPLLPPEVHRHCRVADLEEEAAKLL